MGQFLVYSIDIVALWSVWIIKNLGGVAVACKEAATAKDDAGYFQLTGQVHEKVRISAEKLAGKLSCEKQVLEKEV